MRDLIRKILKEEIDIYLKQISEGLNSPIDVALKKDGDDYEGEFNIDDTIYRITIINVGDNSFLYKFTANNSYNLTNDIKKSFSVIPTIQNNVKYFIRSHNPRIFIFVKTDKSKSRERFYSEFTENTAIEFGYNYSIKNFDNMTFYVMFNDDVRDDEITSIIMSIIKTNKNERPD